MSPQQLRIEVQVSVNILLGFPNYFHRDDLKKIKRKKSIHQVLSPFRLSPSGCACSNKNWLGWHHQPRLTWNGPAWWSRARPEFIPSRLDGPLGRNQRLLDFFLLLSFNVFSIMYMYFASNLCITIIQHCLKIHHVRPEDLEITRVIKKFTVRFYEDLTVNWASEISTVGFMKTYRSRLNQAPTHIFLSDFLHCLSWIVICRWYFIMAFHAIFLCSRDWWLALRDLPWDEHNTTHNRISLQSCLGGVTTDTISLKHKH